VPLPLPGALAGARAPAAASGRGVRATVRVGRSIAKNGRRSATRDPCHAGMADDPGFAMPGGMPPDGRGMIRGGFGPVIEAAA
jgi:hypothetical protein